MSEQLGAKRGAMAKRATIMRLAFPKLLTREALLFLVLVLFIIANVLTQPKFASTLTVGYLLLDAIPILLLALPMTLIIISGEIDLSVASNVGLTAAVIGAMTIAEINFTVTAVVAVLVGTLAGSLNGFLVAVLGLPSLAVTIGTLALFRGLALVVIGANSVGNFPPELISFSTSKIGGTGIPVVTIFVVAVIIIFALVLHRTSFGRGLFALGYSKEAAKFVGVKVQKAKFFLFVVSGLVAGLVGVYWALRYSSARSDSASGLELLVIAAVLLGGTSIFGGKGTIPGTVTGVLLVATLTFALRLQRVPDEALIIVTGMLLIASVVGPSIWASFLDRRQSLRRIPRSTRSRKALSIRAASSR